MSGPPLAFLRSIRWGAKKREVKSWFPSWVQLPPHPTQNAFGFAESLYGVPAAIICYFRGGLLASKLVRVNVTFWEDRPSDDIVEQIYERVRADLLAEYGPTSGSFDQDASIPVEFRQSEMVYWLLPDSVLVLSCALLRDGVSASASSLSVAYSDRRFDPIVKDLV